ncbi:mitochondrial chaperone BCS1 [Acrasis kona]|uniref:Mitochondrial chaperone BCS1 n=1 Tax=Acrasis kona TaxID=1008807 RepID=A0AAW2ZMI1_9EUKA
MKASKSSSVFNVFNLYIIGIALLSTIVAIFRRYVYSWITLYFKSTLISLYQNEFFYGVVVIGLLGSASSAAYKALTEMREMLIRNFIVNASFGWLMQWLSQEVDTGTFVTAPTLKLTYNNSASQERIDADITNKLSFEPGGGFHVINFQGSTYWFTRHSDGRPITAGWEREPFLFEKCSISTFYSKDSRKKLEQLFVHAKDKMNVHCQKDKTLCFTPEGWNGWVVASTRHKKPFDSVVLDGSLSDYIFNDVTKFLSRSEWYHQRGIPFRRGYMLYGPPGCGKSSFVLALAGRLNINIGTLSLTNLDDNKLRVRLQDIPDNCLVLLEDVDAVFADRGATLQNTGKSRRVTLSGLLNAIDGVASQENGRIFIMTTNHLEKLDPALLRPGRSDVKIIFNHATESQINNYVSKFYNYSVDASRLTALIPNKITMAQLQGHLLKHKNNYSEAVNTVHELSSSNNNKTIMPLKQWLRRLGIPHIMPVLESANIRSLYDLKNIDNRLSEIGVTAYMDCNKITGMINGNECVVRDFRFVTKRQAQGLFVKYFPDQVTSAACFAAQIDDCTVSVHETKVYLHKAVFFENCSAVEAANPQRIKQKLIEGEVEPSEPVNCFLNRLNKKYQWNLEEEVITSFTEALREEGIIDVNAMKGISDKDLKNYNITKKGCRLKILRHVSN